MTWGKPATVSRYAAGAEESGLAEGQQPGDSEQDVEAKAEQAPDEDAVDR